MNPKKILLIDDDNFLASINAKRLEQEGFQTIHAVDGERGVMMALAELPDLILLDIAMPKKNGFEVLDELKADPRTKAIPILMLTSLSAPEDIQRCLQAGACEYLIKSQHTPEDVAQQVRKVLLGDAPGFTRVQLLIVVAVVLIAGTIAWFQWNGYAAKQRAAIPSTSTTTQINIDAAAGGTD